jgi:regulator of sigma E protease
MAILEVAIAFGIMVFIHELGHFLLAKREGVPVERFSIGFGPKIIGFKHNGTEYRISAIPLGGYVKLLGEEPEEGKEPDPLGFLNQPPLKRIKILIAGATLNYLMALLILPIVFMLVVIPTTVISELEDGYPAKKAGLLEGDRIAAVNEKKVKSFEEICSEIHPNAGKKLTLTIKRKDKSFKLEIIPIEDTIEDPVSGKKIKLGLIGIRPKYYRYGIGESFLKGLKQAGIVTCKTYGFLGELVTFRIKLKSLKQKVAGPVGIFKIMKDEAGKSFGNFLYVVAMVSLSLAILNLLPIPILDGGHILFAIIEAIRRKPISFKIQERAMYVGLSIILCLFFFATYNDLSRIGFITKISNWVKNIF